MTIGPNSKKIAESIKNIDGKQKDLNKQAVSKEFDEDVSRFIKKEINKKVISKPFKTKSFSNSSSETEGTSTLELLKKLKSVKTHLAAVNKSAFNKYESETIDKFLARSLPSLTSASLVYDYKDKFSTEKPFEKWAFNFSFTDDPESAFVAYDPSMMSSFANKSAFSEYITTDGLVVAEAYKNKTDENLEKYSANADNILILTPADLKESPTAIAAFADAEEKQSAILEHSKYIFWGNPSEPVNAAQMDPKKSEWKSEKFDKLTLFTSESEDGPKIDILRKAFREDPQSGYAVFNKSFNSNNDGLSYVIPDALKYLYVKNGIHILNSSHIGALTADAVTAANRAVGNLTIQNTTYASYTAGLTGDWKGKAYPNGKEITTHAWDVDFGKWFGNQPVGQGFIGDVIYQKYKESSKDNMFATAFGRSINRLHKSGFEIKSEMDLQTSSALSLVNLTITRKLHVATSIGFTMYTKSGHRTTGYITSSDETLPAGTRHGLFAVGRLASMANIIATGEASNHKYFNNPIRDMIATGPDFMSNMYDVYIISYEVEDTGKGMGKVEKLLSLSSGTKVYKAFIEKGEAVPKVEDIRKSNPSSTVSMLDDHSYYDFTTRIASVSIPELKADTIEYNFLNQKYILPGYRLQHEFSSALTIEMDAGLEYMRLFNRMAGLVNKFTDGDGNNTEAFRKGTGKHVSAGSYRPTRYHVAKQKYGILVKIVPGNMFYNPSDTFQKYFIFEDVLFTGGGDVSFSQGNADLVSSTFTFIYKNLAIGNFPSSSNMVKRDSSGGIVHIGEGAYMPAIQHAMPLGHTAKDTSSDDFKKKYDKLGLDPLADKIQGWLDKHKEG